MQNPVETLTSLANSVEISLSTKSIKSIWEDFGFKPLPMAPENHFNTPGVDKWKRVFNDEELKLLDNSGLAALAEELGYQPPNAQSGQSRAINNLQMIGITQRVRKLAGFTNVPFIDSVYFDGTNEALTMKHAENSNTSYMRDWLRSAEYYKAGI